MTQASFSAAQLAATAETATTAIQQAGDKAEALVQAWVAAGNAAAVLEASEQAAGAARKAARRGLNVLKSRGVAIPEPRRAAAAPANTAESLEVQALMLAPDVNGIVVFSIYSRSSTGKTRTCFVLLRDGQGIVRVENGDLSQSKIKSRLREAFPHLAYDPVSVSLDWARSRIAAARKAHAARGLIEPLGFDTAAPLLEPVPAKAPNHPFDDEGFELSDDDANDLTKDSEWLHKLPEFARWFPPSNEVNEMLRKIGGRFTPGQTPEQEQLSTWLKEEIAAATDRFYSPEQRQDLQSRLKDAGLSVLAREGEQAALKLAALIQVIGNAGLVTNPPSEIGFLRGHFEKAISLLLAQNGGRLPIPVAGAAPGASSTPAERAAPAAG
jgi:hypothetical protein